ncbi:1,4-beta-xylanase [Echinicola strongylocentroti]|uniref:Beta-xylanase n=1 Tax=Echinicola strongylocentroti TaxID=1795355 RepID=A0A2Z4IP66_9BACT|nr:endo-1,4-beta-xylanase [Echinicola strongylocentroti]AWW32902.1 1,4-beta-xylanase [Echinicola strongylocentroti]
MKIYTIPISMSVIWYGIFLSLFNLDHPPGIKDLFTSDFYIGAALSGRDVQSQTKELMVPLRSNFNSLSPENLLKWQSIHPEPERFNFDLADRYVEMGEGLDCHLVGHTLVWHKQTPQWVFQHEDGTVRSKEELSSLMENHIQVVMGRYKGRIDTWDVVNEAFTDDGQFRQSTWFNVLGEDFIKLAFQTAHETDPKAELYYNDYNVWKPKKTDGILAFTSKMRDEGINIHGIGMQCHLGLEYPTLDQLKETIEKIVDHGFNISITELDIDVLPNPSGRQGADIDANFPYEAQYDPYKNGLPNELKEKLANRYRDIFRLFLKYRDHIDRVTFWGVRDQDSWLNNWPIPGRTAYPLLFDEDYGLKNYLLDILVDLKENP